MQAISMALVLLGHQQLGYAPSRVLLSIWLYCAFSWGVRICEGTALHVPDSKRVYCQPVSTRGHQLPSNSKLAQCIEPYRSSVPAHKYFLQHCQADLLVKILVRRIDYLVNGALWPKSIFFGTRQGIWSASDTNLVARSMNASRSQVSASDGRGSLPSAPAQRLVKVEMRPPMAPKHSRA